MAFIHLVSFVVLILNVNAREIPNTDGGIQNEIPQDTIKNFALCSNDGGLVGIMNCALSRAFKTLHIASKTSAFEISPGITFEGNENSRRSGKELNEEMLPKDPQLKSSKLTGMVLDAAARFISGRTLKVHFPQTTAINIARALEEGRGKMKKMMGPLLLGLGAKMMTVVPMFMGGLALLSSKALILAKIAFVLSVIIFAQSFFSGTFRATSHGHNYGNGGYGGGYGGSYGGGYGTGYGYGTGGWTTNNVGSQYPYARSIEVADAPTDEYSAQDLAYSDQKS